MKQDERLYCRSFIYGKSYRFARRYLLNHEILTNHRDIGGIGRDSCLFFTMELYCQSTVNHIRHAG